MNNRQPNRRRGRGNNRPPGNTGGGNRSGGFDYQNRVDNRARGNASQMLEKYRKLASDAQMNGDRVNAEYYLQFADHYFRVLADYRSRQEERRPREDQRYDRYDQRDEPRFEERDDDEDRDEEDNNVEEVAAPRGRPYTPVSDGAEAFAEAPPPRANSRARRPRNANGNGRVGHEDDAGQLDLSVLPPAISANGNDEDDSGESVAVAPVRRPRARRPRADAPAE